MVAIGPALVFAAVAEALVLTIVIPQHLPPNPLVWTLIRTTILNLVVYAFYKVLIWPFLLTPLRHLPNPGGEFPIFGNGAAMFQKPPGQDFLKWLRTVPNEGLIYFRGFLYQDRLLVTSPKVLGELLVTKSYDFEKPKPLRDFLRQVLGDGLIIVEGDVHKFQRKHIMPVFQFRHIKELYPMMLRKAKQMTESIQAEIRESPTLREDQSATLEINHWANKVTMDIIGVAGLGRDFNALRNSDDELIQNYEELLEPGTEKSIFFASQIVGPARLVKQLPWEVVKRFRVITGNLNQICINLVRDKKAAIKKGGEEHLDILSVLIRSNNFSDQELSDQMLTFLAAGHETTSSAFTWLTYLLSTHPEIQTRLRNEVRENLPDAIGADTDLATLLESLPILNAVCNETLRLYPTVPITVRQAVRPTELCGQYIPAETQIILSPWAINRSSELWGPNADQFVPDRWINLDGKPNNNGGARSAYAQLTFLHGPRSCIGANFAKAELRCITAMFVKAFNVELADPKAEVVPAGVITTKPRDGMHLRLTPIH
ncbi:cytochrome P450 [Myriangium duriaei CBS 260.36]|uniref:Cytochrome P450 n=1 Tax=Myriangium duriaei CBS 260.36 TaxID=1168546 RepID=A0A9P4J9L5_9PEZI|nr:cytochrome P450 [Myriangium duriaei CBS 260.36]